MPVQLGHTSVEPWNVNLLPSGMTNEMRKTPQVQEWWGQSTAFRKRLNLLLPLRHPNKKHCNQNAEPSLDAALLLFNEISRDGWQIWRPSILFFRNCTKSALGAENGLTPL